MADQFTLTPDAANLAASVRLLLVPTAADDDEFARARRAAAQLALSGSATVVLYDRSDERWTDTPHPDGPFAPGEVDLEGRPHLEEQMSAFTDAGIDVKVWYASVPALTAVISAVQGVDADAVVVPEHLDKPRIMDRLQSGDDTAELIGRVLDQNLERPVHLFVVAEASDDVSVTTTADRTDRPDAAPSEAD